MNCRKIIVLTALALLFAGAAASIGFTETEEMPTQFSGGDSFEINTSFENDAGESIPVVFQLNVYNGTGHEVKHHEAFEMEYTGTDVDTEVSCQENPVGLIPVPASYDRDICSFDEVPEGEYYSSFEISSHVALEPDNYNVELDLLAPAAMNPDELFEELFDVENPVYQKGGTHNFAKEDVTVWMDLDDESIEGDTGQNPLGSETALISVNEIGEVNSGYDEAEFVKGVQVVAIDYLQEFQEGSPRDDQEEFGDDGSSEIELFRFIYDKWVKEDLKYGDDRFKAEASGNITFTYENSEMAGLNPQIYYLNTTSSQWESVETDVNGNTVSADVTHFSVYGLFGEEPTPDSTGGDEEEDDPDGSGPIPFDVDDQQEENNEEEDDEDGSEIDESGEENENQNNNQQSDSTTSPGQNQDDDSNTGNQGQDNPITPQFVADNTGSLGLIGLLMLLAGAVYWKREEVGQLATSLRAQYFS